MEAVSVVMTTRNNDTFLSLAIASVLAQEGVDIELLVVDDASTDRTPSILEEWGKRDRRVRPLDNPECLGRAASRNRAIRAARHDLLAILDGDDLMLPGRLLHQASRMREEQDVLLLGTWAIAIDKDNQPLGRMIRPTDDRDIRMGIGRLIMPFVHSSMMFRKRPLMEEGLYDNRLLASEDFHLCHRMVSKGRAASLPEFLVLYRVPIRPPPSLIRNRYRWGFLAGWDLLTRRPDPLGFLNLLRYLFLSMAPWSVGCHLSSMYRKRWVPERIDLAQGHALAGWVRRLEDLSVARCP